MFDTGTDWADKAKLEAQTALKTRYGMEDDAQGQQGLEVVAKHMKSMYALPEYSGAHVSWSDEKHVRAPTLMRSASW